MSAGVWCLNRYRAVVRMSPGRAIAPLLRTRPTSVTAWAPPVWRLTPARGRPATGARALRLRCRPLPITNQAINSCPARITQELFELIRTMPPSTELEFNEGASPEQPENTLVLAIDVDGQEGHRYGLMLERNLMDDAIDSLWSERRQVAGGPPRWQQLPAYRRGRN